LRSIQRIACAFCATVIPATTWGGVGFGGAYSSFFSSFLWCETYLSMKAISGRIEALLLAAPIFYLKSAMGDGVCLITSFS
jgi:hypothetical protein